MFTSLLLIGSLALRLAAPVQTPAASADTFVNSAENRYRNGDVTGALADLSQALELDARNLKALTYRAFLRMTTRDLDGALADYARAIAVDPGTAGHYAFRAGVKYQKGDSDGAIADATRAVTLDPKIFLGYKTLAVVYLDRVYRSPSERDAAQKRDDIAKGIVAANAALSLNPDDVETVVYKAVLLRLEAGIETDPAAQRALIADAVRFADEAQELRRTGAGGATSPSLPPPAPPQPPAAPSGPAGVAPASAEPVRVGGDVPTPRRISGPEPVYPEIAKQARIQGAVTLEAVVDERGRVTDVKVVKSVPLLDQAAIDAVRQWVYEPTYVRNVPRAVVMSVTVTFTLN